MSPTLLKTGQLKPQGSSYPGTPVLKCIFGHLVFPKSLKHSCQTFWGFTTTVQSMETRYERAIQGEFILNCHLHTILLDVLRHSPLVAHLCRGEAGFFQLLKKKKICLEGFDIQTVISLKHHSTILDKKNKA